MNEVNYYTGDDAYNTKQIAKPKQGRKEQRRDSHKAAESSDIFARAKCGVGHPKSKSDNTGINIDNG